MGLLAEITIRTYHESQAKPTYVIRELEVERGQWLDVHNALTRLWEPSPARD